MKVSLIESCVTGFLLHLLISTTHPPPLWPRAVVSHSPVNNKILHIYLEPLLISQPLLFVPKEQQRAEKSY